MSLVFNTKGSRGGGSVSVSVVNKAILGDVVVYMYTLGVV